MSSSWVRFARAAHEGRRETSEAFLKLRLASECERIRRSAKKRSSACLCVCAGMSMTIPWACLFCARLSTLSAMPARSTPFEDERRDRMHVHVQRCVSILMFSFSLSFLLSILSALAPLGPFLDPLGALLGASWRHLGWVLGGSWGLFWGS